MLPIKTIDHVCLLVSSLQESQMYYERVFGAICQPRTNDPLTLSVETPQIHFFLPESTASLELLAQQHLSFQVDSLESAIASLELMGISDYETGLVDFFKYKNYRWCEWRDPAGIRLECIELLQS